ncbi:MULTISPECIES: VOC family protein [Streptomyces]|uniref:VOC family protein n=1 Tax=Streptomyces glycanivorans TaxID=3033808 RepID=A0ABY9JLG2_9ACTN|nr:MULTISPECIES: VOC family protein [unclassified Streptomyces]WSQ81924.1 VOC family protein [Streptomyces sp. NBC_01213]TXS12538.1 VOC family protein [Streptomyces sp. wa22]WLQ68567.1 VOC family protein [Streptomyces sp. Alt3]WSR04740.1 VOC family protein [Streptomyces sp. NBC_01208]WSR52644.1 VOC family protein [Streptomyces sp. NBC_01201]
MTATVEGPDFLALQVRDVPAAAAFFEERLGLRRASGAPAHAVVFATSPIPFAVREPLPGVDLDGVTRPGMGVALWLRTTDAAELREQLVAAGTEDVGPLQDSPFGPVFSFTGPEGYRLTVHGG